MPALSQPYSIDPPRARFEALDSLRGIAALGVAWGHFYGPPIAGGTRQFAFYLLVDLFFVLSGFVLAHRYLDELLERRVTLKEFTVHRFARLYPLHLYGLIGILLLSLVRGGMYPAEGTHGFGALMSGIEPYPDGKLFTFVMHLFLAQGIGFTPGGLSWHGPSWSISTEFFAPLVLFFWITCWRERLGGMHTSFVLPTSLLALACLLAIHNTGRTLDVHVQNILPWLNTGLMRCFAEAAIGVLAYRCWRQIDDGIAVSIAVATIIEVLLLAAIGGLLFRRAFHSPEDILIVPLFAALVFWLATPRGGLARLLLLRPFQWLGRMSYSIYINHFLVVIALSLVLFKPMWLYFGLVLGLSWLTFKGIEAPARRAINRRLSAVV